MFRVGRALALHEFRERIRDRWVWVISALFALMAGAVSLYAERGDATNALVIGPSLVTLASLFVPLVALVLGHDAICGERERNTLGVLLSLPASIPEIFIAKYLGRLSALVVAVSLGIGTAAFVVDVQGRTTILSLIAPTIVFGAAFLSIGMMLSATAIRQATAISMVVATWFVLVFFYDLGLLGLMVATDGALSDATVTNLIFANPAGLYRVDMLSRYGVQSLAGGMAGDLSIPSAGTITGLWAAWIVVPILTGTLALQLHKGKR